MAEAAATPERQGQRAGIVSRVVANTVDGAVILAISGLLLLGAAVVLYFVTAEGFHIPTIPRWIELPVAIALVAGYFTYGWSGAERTVGQYVMGLRVLRIDGHILTVREALVRTVAYMVFPLGLAWVVVSRREASLQDLVCRTQVVYDWSHRRPAVSPHSLPELGGDHGLGAGRNGQVTEALSTPADHTSE